MSEAARSSLGEELYERVDAAFDERGLFDFTLSWLLSTESHRGVLMELLRDKERERERGIEQG